MTSRARCTLTRAIAIHARHHYRHGGPLEPHGHLYRFEVTVRVPAGHAATIDLPTLDTILTRYIRNHIDGSDLNRTIDVVAAGLEEPTCETLAAWCWRTVAGHLPDTLEVAHVRVAEDGTLWADCTGID